VGTDGLGHFLEEVLADACEHDVGAVEAVETVDPGHSKSGMKHMVWACLGSSVMFCMTLKGTSPKMSSSCFRMKSLMKYCPLLLLYITSLRSKKRYGSPTFLPNRASNLYFTPPVHS